MPTLEEKFKILTSYAVLEPDRLLAMGAVAAEWTYLEHTINQLIWTLLKPKLTVPNVKLHEYKLGSAITSQLGTPGRASLIKVLTNTRIKNKTLKTKLLSFASRFQTLGIDRNDVLHGLWFFTRNKKNPALLEALAAIKTITKKGQLKVIERPLTAHQISQIAVDFSDLRSEITNFLIDFATLLKASP